MALFVDFVGLNTLIEEPVDVNTNTVGGFIQSKARGPNRQNAGRGNAYPLYAGPGDPAPDTGYGPFPNDADGNPIVDAEVRNISIKTINSEDYLSALNNHRNGPYGFPIFRQLRAGQSPVIRRQRLTNIFSHYEYPGPPLVQVTGRDQLGRTSIVYGPDMPRVGAELFIQTGGDPYEISFKNSGGSSATFGGRLLDIDITDPATDTVKKIATRIRDAWIAEPGDDAGQYYPILQGNADQNGQIRHLIIAHADGPAPLSSVSANSNIRVSNVKRERKLVRTVADQRRGPVQHFNEVPVVSKHKPLRVIGSVTSIDEQSNQELLRPILIYTTLGNETQYFSNAKINKYFNTEDMLSEEYENFVDLYLEGGIDSDESPLDEFRLLTYKQVVYPKEIYTYKNHTRNRINFVSRYWRDSRLDRTEKNIDNGFGFTVFSQSAWVLDGEENFKDLTYQITPGSITLSHPNMLATNNFNHLQAASASTFAVTASFPTITLPSNVSNRSITAVPIGDKRIGGFGSGDNSKAKPISGLGGWPGTSEMVYMDNTVDSAIAYSPYDVSRGLFEQYNRDINYGYRKYFLDRGFDIATNTTYKTVRFSYVNRAITGDGPKFSPSDKAVWRTKTTASTISTWLGPSYNPDLDHSYANYQADPAKKRQLFASGTLYHEMVDVGGGVLKPSKIVSFDPGTGNDAQGAGGVTVKLGTVFTSSADGSIIYRGANEPGAVEYRTTQLYGTDNPIAIAATNYNEGIIASGLSHQAELIAAANFNHILVEMNLSGSEHRTGYGLASTLTDVKKKERGALFRQKHSHQSTGAGPNQEVKHDPRGYAKVFVNGKESINTTGYDPYRFLSGSQGNFQQQISNGNTAITLAQNPTLRNNRHLKSLNFPSITPFTSQGFSFSYWIKFGEDPEAASYLPTNDNCIFHIQDSDGIAMIDHTMGGAGKHYRVGIKLGDGTEKVWTATKSSGHDANAWYNVTFKLQRVGSNMDGTIKVYRKGSNTAKGFGASSWTGGQLTAAEWTTVNSSAKLFVLPAGNNLIGRSSATAPTDLDNVSIDSLGFWNGALTTHQMASLISGSSAPGVPGTVGDGVAQVTGNSTYLSQRWPATDNTTALSVQSRPAPMRHGTRNFQLNTYRVPGNYGTEIGRLNAKGDILFPFGSTYTNASFQSNILNTGDAGEMDVSFWFKPTHENFRNRSIRLPSNSDAVDLDQGRNYFNTNVSKRSEMYKGFCISFWYRYNESIHDPSSFMHILTCENNTWGIAITPSGLDGLITANNRSRLCLWFDGDLDNCNSTSGTTLLVAETELDHSQPNDWRFMTVWWNGRTGPENTAAFQIDNGPVEYAHHPAITNTAYAPLNQEDVRLLNNTTSDYQHGINVLYTSATPRSLLFDDRGINMDQNIAQLSIIRDAISPADFQPVRDVLYGNGEYVDITQDDNNSQDPADRLPSSALATALADAKKTYGHGVIISAQEQGVLIYDDEHTSLNSQELRASLLRCANNERAYFRTRTNDHNGQRAQTPGYFKDAPAANKGAGLTLAFHVRRAQVIGGLAFRAHGGDHYLFDITRHDQVAGLPYITRVASLYKEGGLTNRLVGYVGFVNASGVLEATAQFRFNNAVSLLNNTDHNSVVFTWNGKTDGTGKPMDCHLYINGTKCTEDHIHVSGTAKSRDFGSLASPTQITIGSRYDGNVNNLWHDNIYLGAVKFFTQYLGGFSTSGGYSGEMIEDIRASIQYYDRPVIAPWFNDNELQNFVKDASWSFPAAGLVRWYTDSSGMMYHAPLLPPVVDILFSHRQKDIFGSGGDLVRELQNRATRNPVLEHYYPLGQEAEIRHTTLLSQLRKPVLNNSGSAPNQYTQFNVSNRAQIDSGPDYWSVEQYAHTDVDDNGVEQARGAAPPHQQLLFISDEKASNRTGTSLLRQDTHGIELYLSASGGGYRLCSNIGRTTTPEIIISPKDLIVPNRWHHLYASYSDLRDSGLGANPSVRLFLNGNEVTSDMEVVQAGAGNFTHLVGVGTHLTDVPSLGGVCNTTTRAFSGFFQDIAFWNKNNINRATDCRNLYDGIRAGSSYIDTSNGELVQVAKCGFLEGQSVTTLSTAKGSLTGHASSFESFKVSRANDGNGYLTNPPIMINVGEGSSGIVPSEEAGTVISFWARITNTNVYNEIIAFKGDAKFNIRENIVHASNPSYSKSSYLTRTDTSTTPNDTTYTRLAISLRRNSEGLGGGYALKFTEAALKDRGADTDGRGENLVHRENTLTTTLVNNTQFPIIHNTIFIVKNKLYWHINGQLAGQKSFATTKHNEYSTTTPNGIPRLYSPSNIQRPVFNNGWNNITILGEYEAAANGTQIDEVAVLMYPTLLNTVNTSLGGDNGVALATSMYNGGSVYNFDIKKDNLYAWWRMGENLKSTSISVGEDLNANRQIDDDGTTTNNHATTLFANRLRGAQRSSGTETDIKNYYEFTNVSSLDSSLPDTDHPDAVDSINSRNLTINGTDFWNYDFSFDSYNLHPLGWLATEADVTDVVLHGTTDIDGADRLAYDNKASTATIGDFALFTGVSKVFDGSTRRNYDNTKAKTIIHLKDMPASGDKLIVTANPRNVASGATKKQLIINFNITTTATFFTDDGGTLADQDGHANIDVGGGATKATTMASIQTLLQHGTGLNVDGGGGDWTSALSTTTVTNDTLTITANIAGGDGKYEIIAKYIDGANDSKTAEDKISIVSVIGYSHIAKALCRNPGHGWVRQDDSDFSRADNENTHTLLPHGGLIGAEGSQVVKPYLYYFSHRVGSTNYLSYITNRGLGAHHSTNLSSVSLINKPVLNWGASSIDSGSVVTLTLDNTPALDFNDIVIHTGSYHNSKDIPAFRSPLAPEPLVGGSTGARSRFGPGVLQNSYNQFNQQLQQSNTITIDEQLTASACYFRRHTLTASTSFVAPYSGFLYKLSASHNLASPTTALIGNLSASHLFLGSAKWEAGHFAGYFNDAGTFTFKSKKPFYDTYDAFIEQARPLMKDYGIVPEFKISEHVQDYLSKSPIEQKLNFLNITGGLESADSSEKDKFYEIYSTSDFLKHFEVVQEDHSDFVDPYAIRLRCSVVKKFLPYEGFYPAQRTVQVAEQFFKSYGDNINITASADANVAAQYDLSQDKKYGAQYLLNPLFSPGIMYNTIKSGVAVDYPLVTDTGSVKRIGVEKTDTPINGGAMISEMFDTRIPFEALIEPEKHLANITLCSNEPDQKGRTQIEVEWGGQGNQLYNLMISNFLAETSEFFLANKSFTSLASLSQGDANFGNARVGNAYMMRLKMFRTTNGQKLAVKNRDGKSFGVPQDTGSVSDGFTMYSRPSAFGPPQYVSSSNTFTAETWSDFKFDGTSGSMFVGNFQSPVGDLRRVDLQHDFSYVTGATYGGPNYGAVSEGGHRGYNYGFTPPYYHGEAWADITFIPTETKKYTLQEIINQSSVEFYRYFAPRGAIESDGFSPLPSSTTLNAAIVADEVAGTSARKSTLSHVHDRTVLINDQAMQIASSVNIFSQGVLEQDISAEAASGIRSTTNVQVDTDVSNKYRWIIQTKFETPMLNFNHYTYGKHKNEATRDEYYAKPDGTNHYPAAEDRGTDAVALPLYTDNKYGIELPGVGPQQTPIGMWHQYGHIPQDPREGVFLQVDDVPKSWIANAMNKSKREAIRYRSLASLCGFSTEPVRMGEIADVKEISEAVVAIPFFERAGRRRFFTMNRAQIKLAQDPTQKNLVGRTIVDMVEKMKKFVIPPAFDFVNNPEIKPFSMYIFEFTHNLTKQDLSDIWQNLPPDLNETVQTDEASISHQLLAYELLGRGGQYRRGRNAEVELVRNDRADSMNPEIQWMVFKVKQRAKTNYFEKIFARNESQQILSRRLKLGVSADALGRKNKVSYNWPYDFFSMIEGVKLTTEVHFMDIDEEETIKQEKPVVKPKRKDSNKSRKKRSAAPRRLFGAVSGLVPPKDLKKEPEAKGDDSKKKKGKITRKRRIMKSVKKPNTQKKAPSNAFDRKKIK